MSAIWQIVLMLLVCAWVRYVCLRDLIHIDARALTATPKCLCVPIGLFYGTTYAAQFPRKPLRKSRSVPDMNNILMGNRLPTVDEYALTGSAKVGVKNTNKIPKQYLPCHIPQTLTPRPELNNTGGSLSATDWFFLDASRRSEVGPFSLEQMGHWFDTALLDFEQTLVRQMAGPANAFAPICDWYPKNTSAIEPFTQEPLCVPASLTVMEDIVQEDRSVKVPPVEDISSTQPKEIPTAAPPLASQQPQPLVESCIDATDWFYIDVKKTREVGPLTLKQLGTWFQRGQITEATDVRHRAMPSYIAAREVLHETTLSTAAATENPANAPFSASSLVPKGNKESPQVNAGNAASVGPFPRRKYAAHSNEPTNKDDAARQTVHSVNTWQWKFSDARGDIQGPYTTNDMLQNYLGGLIGKADALQATLVKNEYTGTWAPVEHFFHHLGDGVIAISSEPTRMVCLPKHTLSDNGVGRNSARVDSANEKSAPVDSANHRSAPVVSANHNSTPVDNANQNSVLGAGATSASNPSRYGRSGTRHEQRCKAKESLFSTFHADVENERAPRRKRCYTVESMAQSTRFMSPADNDKQRHFNCFAPLTNAKYASSRPNNTEPPRESRGSMYEYGQLMGVHHSDAKECGKKNMDSSLPRARAQEYDTSDKKFPARTRGSSDNNARSAKPNVPEGIWRVGKIKNSVPRFRSLYLPAQ
eukprot:GEMP01019024.1.p1 GENE.GEMP01019024.1~~GEMP01019024.1.p1  ORF type:complete len:702 (+),score=117.04 GEMP01019024.1:334-2439(+)